MRLLSTSFLPRKKPWRGYRLSTLFLWNFLFTLQFLPDSEACVPKLTNRKSSLVLPKLNSTDNVRVSVSSGKPICENCTSLVQVTADPNLAEENRRKRQLFREDIPHHRPLTGNIYALYHGFPHPGRFREHRGNSLGVTDDDLGQYQGLLPERPQSHQHLVYETTDELSPHGYKTVTHGNEIVHQYPVEISQIIQLDHDIKSHIDPHAPPKVHPDQTFGPHPLNHHANPLEPADLVVQEPNGDSPFGQPPEPEAPPPHPQKFANYYPAYANGYNYQDNPYRLLGPYSGAYKIAQFLKNFPLLFNKVRGGWPFGRRFRSKIKHQRLRY